MPSYPTPAARADDGPAILSLATARPLATYSYTLDAPAPGRYELRVTLLTEADAARSRALPSYDPVLDVWQVVTLHCVATGEEIKLPMHGGSKGVAR